MGFIKSKTLGAHMYRWDNHSTGDCGHDNSSKEPYLCIAS